MQESICPMELIESNLCEERAMPELDHTFENGQSTDYNWDAILDLERVIPCVEGGRVIERTSPESCKAEILVKMGAMSMKFTGTVDVIERDDAEHKAVLKIKSREAGCPR